jgi:predicted ArsR family transcriptional regulator
VWHDSIEIMPSTRWTQRFSRSTRGRIVALLRDRPRTVEELASALGLTDNAVRAHLAALERDELVEHLGVRRTGATRPAHTYGVVAEAEALFSKAYVPLLGRTLEILAERMGSRKLEALMQAAGRRLTPVDVRRPHGRASRLAAAAEFLNELGASALVERVRAPSLIRSRSCPVAAVAKTRPEVCAAMASLVGALVEAPARQRCERENGRARCLFEIGV